MTSENKKIFELNDGNFDQVLSDGVVLVDFWAPWCGPCRMQTPILERLLGKVSDGVKVGKVNVDDAPGVAGRYGIRSIPTIMLFKNGAKVQEWIGVQRESVLYNAITEAT
ncbi:MAG: thioredoxin [Verrucomicrobia bacterium]|nr:thioredoxin [Verrucomicrobiota bacterium]MCF7708612.1 thioredoxin [Verrucomicrobiota bacterium]